MRLQTQSAVMMKMLAMTLCLHFISDSQCLAQVWFAERSGNNWSYTEIDPLAGSGNSLVFDASGNPHITYAVYDQTLSSSILKYATRTSGTWTTRTLENLGSPPAQYQPGPPPIPTSLAINPVTMRPNVFYLTQANATPTSYRYGEVTLNGFVSEPVDSASRTAGTWYASEGNYASLAIDSAGKPNVAYWRLEPDGSSDLLCAVRTGTAWSSSTVATGRVFFSSLALNSDQTAGIAFYRETVAGSQGDLFFASPTNSGWQSEFVDGNTSGRYIGFQPSLAFGSDNMPRIAYTDFHDRLIKYAVKTGTGWEKESIASTGRGDTQAFSSLIVTATSVMNLFTDDYIDPIGVTRVCDQYLSTRTEAGWRSEFLTPSSSGAWNSLALNASNQPAFVFSSAVPEPSTCFPLAAGLIFGGWHVFKRSCRRSALVISRSIAALVVATCSVVVGPTYAVNYEMVTVGDAGNAADTTGYGAVPYEYQIGKYEVTIGQYVAFLNAVAATDTHSLYKPPMGTDGNIRGIQQTGSPGNYTYTAIGSPSRPITYVTWYDAARFANWMTNGQGNGSTETGAYDLSTATPDMTPAKSPGATFYIPNENEWCKAAYFSPSYGGAGVPNYYVYATQSNTAPGNQIGSAANQANYNNGVYSVTQSAFYDSNPNYLTEVGAFSGSGSFYGTFDQNGNVHEWIDLDGNALLALLRGGEWLDGASGLSSSHRTSLGPSYLMPLFGFRLAAPAAVPEPSTCFPLAAGLALGCWRLWSRRTSGN